jgi:hypothetical protein
MAYQDDFRNKVLAALKAKNLAVDISQEATQQAIVEEVQNVAASESRPMSAEEMRSVLQDVATQLATDNNQTFSAQSTDFTALYNFPEGAGPGGSYSGGGIALSTANKDIMIIPAAGALGAAGLATSVNSLSQIDFKHIANPNAYNQFDPNEVKSSIYNWAERKSGQLFDTPVLGIGGAWGGVSYAPTSGWGVQTGSIGGSQGSGVGGSINFANGFGQIIYIKPASSTFYAALYNDVGINVDAAIGAFSLTGYLAATPNTIPTAGFAVTFGGTGGSGDLIIQGALLGTQVNTARFGSSLSILNSTATDTLVLGLSSATIVGTATSVNFPGGTGATTNTYVLATNAPTFALGDIFYSAGVGHTTLARLAVSGNNQYLTTVAGVPQWTNTISATTVAVNAATGSTILYPLLNNSAGSGSAVSTDIDFSVDPAANILRYATGSFYVGTAVSAPTYTGAGSLVTYTSPATVIIKPGTNAVNAILMQASAGSTVVNVDTTNGRVSIGSGVTAPVYTLDVLGDTNLSSTYVYRIAGTSVLSSNTLGTGVITSSLTQVGVISNGTWAATAITAYYGGTGYNSYTLGDLLVGAGNTFIKLAAVATGSYLASQGTGTAPAYVALNSTTVGFASVGNSVRVADANSQGTTYYLAFSSVQSGAIGLSTQSSLTYDATNSNLSATRLTGTIQTAAQPNITSASSLVTVGTIGTGVWQGTAIATTYGGTGSNLGSAIGNSNKVVITGTIANGYAASLIDGANTGYLLAANGNGTAPSFVNTTNAAFSFAQGTLTINSATITTGTIATTPTGGTDIANKSYVDSISGGLDPHASVRLTTISAIGGSYRQAGSAGTTWGQGDYIIATTPAELIGVAVGLDTPTTGIALTNGQRVLIKDGVLGSYATGLGNYALFSSITTYGGFAASYVANGIYTVASYGGAATSGWLLIRATDTDNGSGVQELTGGTFTFVEEGTQFADNAFVCTNDTTSFGAIGFGATQITWSAFSGGASLTMGQGLSKSGNTVATNFNFTNDSNLVSGIQYKGFSLGGVRSGGVGFSSLATFTVSSTSAPSSNTLTALGTGFTLAGGETSRTLTVNGTGNVTLDGGNNTLTLSGSSITLTGGGNTLTLSSSSTLNFNSQTLALTASMGNLTFSAGNSTPSASTQNIVQNGLAQYQLSVHTGFSAGDLYYGAGAAFTALARLAFGSGTGNSVLIRGASQPTWGTIALGNSDFVSGILTTTNGGTGANLDTSIGKVVYTDGTKLAVTSVGTSGQTLLSTGSGAPAFGTLTLAGGGTSNTASGVNVAWQLAAYNSVGSGISGIAQATANNSVLLQASANSTPVWSNGPLAIAYGGSNATTSNFTNNGVVIYDSGNTRLTSATGLTMTGGFGLSVTGTVAASGGFFVGSNSVLTSVTPVGGSAIYGGVGISVLNLNPAGAISISGSGQTIIINGPGTGITGTGAVTQIPYYSAARELTGDIGLVYSRTAATGTGLSLNINSATGNIFSINTTVAMTAGNLIDFDVNGVQRFGVDWKGMATHTASASGNTALVIAGGRTVLAPANANYASLNFGITNANPGSGTSFQGDLWYNGTNLYFQTGATTKFDLLVGSVSGSGTINKVVKWNTTTSLTDSNISDAGVGMTITSTSTIAPAAGGGSTSVLTLQTISADNQLTDRYFLRGVTSAGTRLFSIDTAGNLRATTKSFDIPHPTKEGLRLVYGVLEGPEHGVYHRGTVEGKGTIQVNLPDYWHKLVGEQYTIQLTPWGNYNVGIGSKTENYFTIQLVGDFISRKYKNIKVDYIVHGSRLDAPLDTEQ